MKKLEEKIIKEGKILPGNIVKIDNFLNHQIDTKFLYEIGNEIFQIFKNEKIDKILTIESSGIAIAVAAASYFNYCPVVFAKKNISSNISKDVYTSKAFSYTKQKENIIVVSKDYLKENENILIVDDFLATGQAFLALIDIVNQAKANIIGCLSVVEKVHQNGEQLIKEKDIRVESLAKIKNIENNKVEFE